MPDITYTAQGTFDHNRNAIINVCIPPEPKPGSYITEMYNLSKITASGSINAIFCYFSDGSQNAMHWNSFDYRMTFNLNILKHYAGAVDFNETKDDALFIFFHNDKFEKSDRDFYFSQIEVIYDELKHIGNQNQDSDLSASDNLCNPRKVGLSLVTKLR